MATSTKHQDKLELLKDILLPEEHKALEELSLRVIELEKQGREQRELLKHLELKIDQKLEELKRGIAQSMDSTLLATLKKEIDKNPEAVSELLSPLTANLLNKHNEEKKIARRHSLGKPFRSISNSWRSFTHFFSPVSESKKAEKQLKSAVVEQLLVIERKSRSLKASFAENDSMDESRISVICGVVNDYIQKHDLGQDQHLAVFTQGPHQIYVQGFIKHFVALVIPGKRELECREKIQDIIFSFYYQFLADNLDLLDGPKSPEGQKRVIDRRGLDKAMEKHFKKDSA